MHFVTSFVTNLDPEVSPFACLKFHFVVLPFVWGNTERWDNQQRAGHQQRDEALQLLSSGQMCQADEKLEPITCLCILDQRGHAAPQLWRSSDCRSGLVTWPPSVSIPHRHRCLPEEPRHHSAFTSLASFVSECLKEAPWTRLILNMQDIFRWITKDLNIVAQQDSTERAGHNNRLIIFCDEDIPLHHFGGICCTKDSRMSIADVDWHISDHNVIHDLKTSCWPESPNANNSEGFRHELVTRDNFNTCNDLKSLLKSCEIYNALDLVSGRAKNVKKRKSVSFDDDVIVYLFDQESPTMELNSGPCTSLPSSYSCSVPDAILEDSGLEWEDDFSALEKNCHFQCVARSASHHCTLSLPTQSCSVLSRPERFFLPQACLFLTHVTESDLEL